MRDPEFRCRDSNPARLDPTRLKSVPTRLESLAARLKPCDARLMCLVELLMFHPRVNPPPFCSMLARSFIFQRQEKRHKNENAGITSNALKTSCRLGGRAWEAAGRPGRLDFACEPHTLLRAGIAKCVFLPKVPQTSCAGASNVERIVYKVRQWASNGSWDLYKHTTRT